MLVIMRADASQEQMRLLGEKAVSEGFRVRAVPGRDLVFVVTGERRAPDPATFAGQAGVAETRSLRLGYELASREAHPDDTIVAVGGVPVGGRAFVVVGGPCAVESLEQTLAVARRVKAAGGHILRGGAFKPRTHPYSFQGLGEEGLKILAAAREETGLPVVTEALDVDQVDMVERYADAIQVGSRNMHNFPLLRRVGRSRKPVLLKRGFAATLEEFLGAAEYVLAEGNDQVVLCERGIRTFSDFSRNTLDLTIVPALKQVSHLPIIVDPSHAAGRRDMIVPLSRAGAAVGADGVMVEVYEDPCVALCDGAQAVATDDFDLLIRQVGRVAESVDRPLYKKASRTLRAVAGSVA